MDRLVAAVACVLAMVACGAERPRSAAAVTVGEGAMAAPALRLASPAFEHGAAIPARHTADGANVAPRLVISGAPAGTVSFALIVDDPDAPVGTWVHWVVWNLPGTTTVIAEGALPAGVAEGRNSWGRSGWGGPSPPSGSHRYFFRLAALDTVLKLPPSTDAAALRRAIAGHVLGEAELMGTYSRRR